MALMSGHTDTGKRAVAQHTASLAGDHPILGAASRLPVCALGQGTASIISSLDGATSWQLLPGREWRSPPACAGWQGAIAAGSFIAVLRGR